MIDLGVYWTLGDYGKETTLEVLEELVAKNDFVTLLELGLPFSDPLLDGPLIQQSHHRVTESGYSIDDAIETLHKVSKLTEKVNLGRKKEKKVQISVMTASQLIYENDIRARLPKVDGILVTDIASANTCPFNLPSPRVWFVSQEVVLDQSFSGLPADNVSMIYLTRLKGITGEGQAAGNETKQAIQKLKKFTDKPVWLGFGISNSKDLQECEACGAHGAIIGSAFIRKMNENLAAKHDVRTSVQNWLKYIKY
jgi:tryptophan synthase alpha chain